MQMKYKLNDKPSLLPMLLYGLQWWIVSIPCVIIMGNVIAQIHYTDIGEQIIYMQKLFAIMGTITIIQILWGHKLPLIIGPASVLLISITSTLSSGIPAIYTAIALGGGAMAFIAYSGLLSKIRKLFTPRIIAVILMLIAFTLMPTILRLIVGPVYENMVFNLIFGLLLTFAILITNKLLQGVWKSTTVLWGIIVGSVVYFAIKGLPTLILSSGHWNSDNLLLPSFDFNTGTILAFTISFIALIVNEMGSIEAVGNLLKAENMENRTRYGIGLSGISNIISGLLGVIGPVDDSMSSGVISSTGCASRYTLIPAGFALIACAFCPVIIGLLTNIPSVVMGALLLYLMATQLSTGLTMTGNGKIVTTFSDGITVGLPIMVAMLISFVPADLLKQMPEIIHPIIGNGFVMGTVTVIILEHIIFREKKERNSTD